MKRLLKTLVGILLLAALFWAVLLRRCEFIEVPTEANRKAQIIKESLEYELFIIANPNTAIEQARKLNAQDRHNEAANHLLCVLSKHPENIDALQVLIVSLVVENRPKDAIEFCIRLLELAPNDAESWDLLAMVKELEFDHVGAAAALRKAVELNPAYQGRLERVEKKL